MTRDTQRGFTLIELMVSLVLFSFAVAGVLAVAVSMTQGFRENRMTNIEEQSARVPMDYLTDALRQASPGVTDPSQVQDADTCQIGAITVTDGGATGTDSLDVIYMHQTAVDHRAESLRFRISRSSSDALQLVPQVPHHSTRLRASISSRRWSARKVCICW